MSQFEFPAGPLPAVAPQQADIAPVFGVAPPETRGHRKQKPAKEPKYAPPTPVGEKKKLITVVGKKARLDDVAETLEDLASMLEAGESEERALTELGKQYSKFNIGGAYTRAAARMRDQGATFIDAMCAEEDAVPRVARELIRASATPRDLQANLRNAAMIVVEATDIKALIRSSLFKPILLLAMVLAFLIVAGEFLLPQVGSMFENIGADTPEATTIMIGVGSSMKWVILGLVAVILLWTIYWFAFGRRVPR
uniref:type II secretion system F family protein n=1 Tax=Agromyces humi TaxID=1766800 RepID=UPI001359B40B